MIVIPFATFASFTEEVVIDNIPYKLVFNWNHRGQFWTAIWSDTEGNIVYAGMKLVMSHELIIRFPDRGLPSGAVTITDPTRTITRIGRDDMGKLAFLIYATEEEFNAV